MKLSGLSKDIVDPDNVYSEIDLFNWEKNAWSQEELWRVHLEKTLKAGIPGTIWTAVGPMIDINIKQEL